MEETYYFPDETSVRDWLDDHDGNQVEYNEPNSYDGEALELCIEQDPDLLILSQHINTPEDVSTVASTVMAAKNRGAPIPYIHVDGNMENLGEKLFPIFDVNYVDDNYWRRLQLTDFAPSTLLKNTTLSIAEVKTVVEHLHANTFDIDWAGCNGNACFDNEPWRHSRTWTRVRTNAI